MLRGIWVRFVLVVMTPLVGLPATIVALLVPRWSNAVMHAGRIWSRSLLAAAGARVTYHGLEHVDHDNPCIFIANHQSMVDIWVLFDFIPPSTRFVAKRELFKIPVFGWALSAAGCISIDRANRANAIRSLSIAAERIRSGRSVILFPEGTRSSDGRLQRFKKGAFYLAVQAGVPVVPVAITGSFAVVPPRKLRVSPGPVEVYIEPPIDVASFQPENTNGLLALVHETIERRFNPSIADEKGAALRLESS